MLYSRFISRIYPLAFCQYSSICMAFITSCFHNQFLFAAVRGTTTACSTVRPRVYSKIFVYIAVCILYFSSMRPVTLAELDVFQSMSVNFHSHSQRKSAVQAIPRSLHAIVSSVKYGVILEAYIAMNLWKPLI